MVWSAYDEEKNEMNFDKNKIEKKDTPRRIPRIGSKKKRIIGHLVEWIWQMSSRN